MVDRLDEGAIPSSSTITTLTKHSPWTDRVVMMGLIQDSTGVEKFVRD